MRHLFVLIVRDDEHVDESMGDDPELVLSMYSRQTSIITLLWEIPTGFSNSVDGSTWQITLRKQYLCKPSHDPGSPECVADAAVQKAGITDFVIRK
jgi:hypothetical protein